MEFEPGPGGILQGNRGQLVDEATSSASTVVAEPCHGPYAMLACTKSMVTDTVLATHTEHSGAGLSPPSPELTRELLYSHETRGSSLDTWWTPTRRHEHHRHLHHCPTHRTAHNILLLRFSHHRHSHLGGSSHLPALRHAKQRSHLGQRCSPARAEQPEVAHSYNRVTKVGASSRS